MTTKSKIHPESQLRAFVESSAKLVPAEQARILLEHAASCEECAGILREKPAHAEALLESMHPAPEWTPAEVEVVKAAPNEIVVFADAVLERLKHEVDSTEFRNALVQPLPRARHEEFWAVGDIETPRLHIALACSAIKLAVSAWLATGPRRPTRAVLTLQGLNVNGKMIQNSLFAERIADYAVLPLTCAEKTWKASKEVAIVGKHGVPGIYSMIVDSGIIGLALTPKGLERWRIPLEREGAA
jgi:hypothetical protein